MMLGASFLKTTILIFVTMCNVSMLNKVALFLILIGIFCGNVTPLFSQIARQLSVKLCLAPPIPLDGDQLSSKSKDIRIQSGTNALFCPIQPRRSADGGDQSSNKSKHIRRQSEADALTGLDHLPESPIRRKDGDLLPKLAKIHRKKTHSTSSIDFALDNFSPKVPARLSDSAVPSKSMPKASQLKQPNGSSMAISIMPATGNNSLTHHSKWASPKNAKSPPNDIDFMSIKTKKFRISSRMISFENGMSKSPPKNHILRRVSNPSAPKPPKMPHYATSSVKRPSNLNAVDNGTMPEFNKVGSSLKQQIEEQKKYLIPTNRNSDPVNLAANNPKKMIDMLKNGNFLDLEPIPDAGPLIYKKDLCNRFFIGNMQILRLKHDNQNKINQYYVFPKPISGGATSRVFHASPLDAVDIDGKPIKQCVTIKSVMLDLLPPEVMDDIRKEQQFLEVFRKKTHNKHIIHLFDEFEDTTKNRLIFVMERGEQDLMKHLQKLSQEWSRASPGMLSIKQTITDILNQVVDAVAEMHKTIIHLDLKSDNLIFVKENIDGVEKEVLKVIDFGGSEFIKPDKESALDERQVSNVCKLRKTMWSDDRYSSPEQIKLCQVVEENEPVYPVSSKSDIWAIGMMLIEFLLMTPVFNIDPVVVKRSKDYKNIYNAVINLNRYHYSKKKVQKPVKPYKIYLKTIEVQFPKFYQIIEACLSSNPQHRPTAKGIKDFLDGKCKFSMWTHVNGKNKCDMGVWVKPPKKV